MQFTYVLFKNCAFFYRKRGKSFFSNAKALRFQKDTGESAESGGFARILNISR